MNRKDIINSTAILAIVSGIFIAVISLLLIINHIQLTLNDPLESKALESLVQRAYEEPQNQQLREDIRHLDLLARKAYFTSRWQSRTGAWILIVGAVIFLASLRIHQSLTRKITIDSNNKISETAARLLNQRWILGTGTILVLAALIGSFVINNHFSNNIEPSQQEKLAENKQITEPEEQIETIDIKEPESKDDLKTQTETEDSINTQEVKEDIQEQDNTKSIEQVDKVKVKTASITKAGFPTQQQIENNFNAFRGLNGNGIVNVKNPPTKWDAKSGKNILWKTAIPVHGYNSPVIWDDKLLLAGGNEQKRVIYCYNRHTGKLIWEHLVANVPGSPAKPPKTTDDTGLSAPSVTTDGKRIAAIFGNGDITVVDMNGKTIWAKNLGVPDNHYGHSSSLLLSNEKILVQFDSNKGGKAFALNLLTGETIWEIKRDTRISWASPILANINGILQVIMSSNPNVGGYEVETGKELWSVKCMTGEVGPSPAFGEGLIFAGNEYAKLVAIDPANNYKIKWESMDYLPEVASPVVSNGLLFIATSYGMLVCFDAQSGEIVWEQEYANGFYGSPIIAGKYLYATDMDGITHIIEPAREYKVISEPKLYEKVVTTPAFKDKVVYIRGEKFLYAIGTK